MEKVYKGCIWIEIRRSIYCLPQAGKLANEFLRKKLAPHGYFEVKHTPGLWNTHLPPPPIHTCGWQLCRQVHKARGRRAFAQYIRARIHHSFYGMGWGTVLRYHVGVELQREVVILIDAGLHQKGTTKIFAREPDQASALTINCRAKEIQERCP